MRSQAVLGLFLNLFRLPETGHVPGVVAALWIHVKVGATRCGDLDAKIAVAGTATFAAQPVARYKQAAGKGIELVDGQFLGLGDIDLGLTLAANFVQVGRLAGKR